MEALVETEADDLTVIEGIGPKISATLNQAGIMTYAQLADAEADRLDQIINQAGLRMVSVETWSEQAELARQALMLLRESDQEILRLALWEDLAAPDIAAVLGLTEPAVAMRFARAKRRIGEKYRALEARCLATPSRAGNGVIDDQR